MALRAASSTITVTEDLQKAKSELWFVKMQAEDSFGRQGSLVQIKCLGGAR